MTLFPLYVLLELHINFKDYITIICGTLQILCLGAWLDDVKTNTDIYILASIYTYIRI
jgi:hypothetical protein